MFKKFRNLNKKLLINKRYFLIAVSPSILLFFTLIIFHPFKIDRIPVSVIYDIVIPGFINLACNYIMALYIIWINEKLVSSLKASAETDKYETLSSLTAGMSHSLRNNLEIVKGAISLLFIKLEKCPIKTCESCESFEVKDLLAEPLQEMEHLVRDLMVYANPNRDRQHSVLLPIHSLITRTITLFKASDASKLIRIEEDINIDHRAAVLTRERDIFTILLNFLMNSSEAMDKPEKMILVKGRCKEINGKLTSIIKIEDNGCGISDVEMKNLYVPFHTTKKSGNGLGMSLSKSLIDSMGGTLNIESKVGIGTKVYILLPTSLSSEET